MAESISELIFSLISIAGVFGAVFGAIFYVFYRLAKSRKILRKLKYLSDRSANNGYVTAFDLATEAEISPKEAKKALDKYIRELEGEKLVSDRGEVYYAFPRGEKIFKEQTQLQHEHPNLLESASGREIKPLKEPVTELQKPIESDK